MNREKRVFISSMYKLNECFMKNTWKKFHEHLFFAKFVLLLFVILQQSCEMPDPEQIRKNQYLPEKGFTSNISLGKIKFETYCMRCHGKTAQGSDHGPPLVDEIYKSDHHADQAFRWAVKDGVTQHHWRFGNMPPIREATPKDVAHIIAYVRRLQR